MRPRKPRNEIVCCDIFVGEFARPAGRMPIVVHQEVARLLHDVVAHSYFRKSVANPASHVRCMLDEFVQREYTRAELPAEIFSTMYYNGGPYQRFDLPYAHEREKYVRDLLYVKGALRKYYPPCNARDDLLKSLDKAIKALVDWKPSNKKLPGQPSSSVHSDQD